MAINPKAHFEFFCEKITVAESKPNILIIKLGAMGDVIRTTPLLRILSGNIFWVTGKESLPLLPLGDISYALNLGDADNIMDISFDLVLCLDDEYEAAQLATSLKKETLIGSYVNSEGLLTYTESSAEWFDMGLISRFGKEKADGMKERNTKCYQEIIFNMLGKPFKGEEYLIKLDRVESKAKNNEVIIGVESRTGNRWPMKSWDRYEDLAIAFRKEGFQVRVFQQREQISDYIQDINNCDVIVCGDTLGMHIALALKKKVVALFICTSPREIYGYGRMIKVVSPLLDQYFYKRDYFIEPVNAVSFSAVYSAVKSCLGR